MTNRSNKILLILLILSLTPFGYTISKKKNQLALWYQIRKDKPDWVKEQIGRDFAPFSQITQPALNETFHKIEQSRAIVYRYRIVDGTIYRSGKTPPSDRPPTFEKMLKRLHKSQKLPNIDFIVCTMDGVPEVYVPDDYWIVADHALQAPLLAWARKESAQQIVLIPDHITTLENSWHRWIDDIETEYPKVSWEKRIEKAYWRGTASDKHYLEDNYRTKPRFLLSEHSLKTPELVDAGFMATNVPYFTELFQKLGLFKPAATHSEQLQFKYLPVLDGWMCTYPGFQWRLLSGSLALKQESDEIQYFYSALKPYVHYLPIKHDMSDLIEKIEWAKSHDNQCRQIAAKGREFALNHFMPNQIYAYLYWVLDRYASLQTFNTQDLVNEMKNDPNWIRVK